MKIGLYLPLLFFALFFQCTTTSQQREEKNDSVSTANEMPALHITTLNNEIVDTKGLKGNTIFILFQSDCDHCQREAQEIRNHLTSFVSYQIYFVSADSTEAVQKFANDYDLSSKDNISFAIATVDEIIKNFGSIPTPSVYIYRDQQLIHKFHGEVKIEKILEVL